MRVAMQARQCAARQMVDFPSGAKAQFLLLQFYGTTKVVPFQCTSKSVRSKEPSLGG